MTILFAAAEVAPFASTGGLGEVITSLPKFVSRLGYDVAVALPGYPSLMQHASPIGVTLSIQLGSQTLSAEIFERIAPDGTQWLLIHQPALFDRPGLYGSEFAPYPDNAARFIFFSKAVVELARRIQPHPEVLHLHDWHTALVPVLVRDQRLPIKTVLTVHNAQHQGSFWALDFALTNLPGQWFSPNGLEFFGQMNLLKGGILAADTLTTVSSTYRSALLSGESAFGLEPVLLNRQHDFFAIPNGVDPDLWNSESTADLSSPFSSADLSGKTACRQALLSETKLAPNPKGPVFAMLGRLADQKGLDVLLPLLPRLLASDSRLILAGDGDPTLRRDLFSAVRQHPARMAYIQSWEPSFSRRLLAGSDVLLVPSHTEPCGLAPLFAQRYGTIPLAHATGGLLENLVDYDPVSQQGDALLYFQDRSAALWDCLQRATQLFHSNKDWQALMRRAMQRHHLWDQAANRYDSLYKQPQRPF